MAFGIGEALSIGGSLLGGLMGGSAADKAAKQQAAAAQAGIDLQREQYGQTRSDLTPWRKSGKLAVNKLDYLLGLRDPSYYNPATQSAQRDYNAAKREYEQLQKNQPAAPSSGPQWSWQRDAGDDAYGWVMDNRNPAGNTGAYFGGAFGGGARGGGGAGGGDYGKQLSGAKKAMDRARSALEAARAQTYNPGEGYGSLMKPFGMEDFQVDPGYQFRQSEGNKAIENAAAARGMQLSGANLKGLTRFNQDLAKTEYGAAFNRDALEKDRSYNYLTGVSGSGQNAAAMTGQLGANMANSTANLLGQQGNALAAGTVGSANAWGNALGDVGSYLQLKSLLRGSA